MKPAMLRNAGMLALLASALATVAAVPSMATPKRTFDSVVTRIEHEFSIQGHRFPLLGFASGLARIFTWGGVKRIRMAEFGEVGSDLNADTLDSVIRDALGRSWRPFIIDRNRESGETTFVYEHPSRRSISLMIADLDRTELSLFQVKLSEERLAAWLNRPRASLKNTKQNSW